MHLLQERPSLKVHCLALLPLPLDLRIALVAHEGEDEGAELLDVRLEARLLPVGGGLVLVGAVLGGCPAVDLGEEALDGGDGHGVEGVEAGGVDGDADAAGARVHDEGGLEQMVELLGDLDVEARVRVLEHDILLGLEQRARV